jgi:hypothetical protein
MPDQDNTRPRALTVPAENDEWTNTERNLIGIVVLSLPFAISWAAQHYFAIAKDLVSAIFFGAVLCAVWLFMTVDKHFARRQNQSADLQLQLKEAQTKIAELEEELCFLRSLELKRTSASRLVDTSSSKSQE